MHTGQSFCTYWLSCSNMVEAFITSFFTTGPIRMFEYCKRHTKMSPIHKNTTRWEHLKCHTHCKHLLTGNISLLSTLCSECSASEWLSHTCVTMCMQLPRLWQSLCSKETTRKSEFLMTVPPKGSCLIDGINTEDNSVMSIRQWMSHTLVTMVTVCDWVICRFP